MSMLYRKILNYEFFNINLKTKILVYTNNNNYL